DQGIAQPGGDSALQKQPPRARAALSRSSDRAEYDSGEGQFQIRVIHHDDPVVSAQLQNRPPEPLRHADRYLAPGASRSGEADQGKPPVGRNRATYGRTFSGAQIENTNPAVSL